MLTSLLLSKMDYTSLRTSRRHSTIPYDLESTSWLKECESRGAEASQNFTASRSTTNAAANFANGADNAARSGDKIRQNVQGAHDKLSDVGKRIAEMSHAPSIGNDPSSGVKTTTATMGEGEDETRTKDGAMSSGVTGAMASGMEKLTDKMSNMGSSIAEKMKPLEGLADSMATPHMPKVVENLKETVTSTVSSATEKVKQAMPHSIDEAKDAIAKKMPSMDSVKSAVNSVKDSMPSMPKSVNDAKEAVSKSMPSMNDAKNAAAGAAKTATDTAKSAASTVSHSMPSMETAKNVASHKMEEGKETLKRSADYVKDKASEATHMAKDAATGPTAASVIDQFKQGVQTMKEAMKPIVNTATEKIKEGAHIAAEKIPPMASSIKDNVKTGAAAVMNSSTVESIKDTVTSAAKGTYEKAKDAASSAVTGKSDAAKMNIKEDTTKVSKSKLEAKDQEMSSSDIYKA